MKLKYLQEPGYQAITKLPKSKEFPRHWLVTEDIEVELSDGRIITIEKGFLTDGASIPKWLCQSAL